MDRINPQKKQRSPWPFAIVAFFIVVFSVNMGILTAAKHTADSLIEEHPYEAGIAYEQTIQALREAKALGITAQVATTEVGNGNQRLAIFLSSHNGPVVTASIRAKLLRPDDHTKDRLLIVEHTPEHPGSYQVETAPLTSGLWLLELEAELEKPIVIKQKLFIE